MRFYVIFTWKNHLISSLELLSFYLALLSEVHSAQSSFDDCFQDCIGTFETFICLLRSVRRFDIRT